MRNLGSSQHGWGRLGLLWALVALVFLALAVAPSSFAFDHPRDDGHGRRSDPDDPPDPDEPPDEPEDECTGTSSPVYLREGNLVLTFRDVEISSRLPLDVQRTYNSQDDRNGLIGRGWAHGYELRAIPITDGDTDAAIVRWLNGQRQTFVEQPDGTYAKPLGCPASLEAAGGGFRITRPDEVSYETDDDGDLVRIFDRNGNAADVLSDPIKGCVDSISYAGGSIDVAYGANGRIASITAPGGRTVAYGYDATGNLTSVTDPVGDTTTYVYDSLHRLTQIRDPLGRTTLSVTYDSQSRVSRLIDADGDVTYTYYGNRTVKRDNVTGGQSTYFFDAKGVVTSVTDPLGNTTSKVYDPLYNLASETDANGNTTSYTYDLAGNRLSQTDALGNVTTWTYNAQNLVETMTDPLGVVTRLEVDAAGNRTRMIQAEGTAEEREWSFTYSAEGDLLSQTDPDGLTTTYTYDAAGNRLSATDPLGNATTYAYDAAGNRVSVTDPAGHTTSFVYDALGRVTLSQDSVGVLFERTYDAAGNLASETDGRGNTASFTYDAFGRVLSATDRAGDVRTWQYGPFGVTRFTDGAGAVTLVEYDLAGRISRQVIKLNDTGSVPDADDQVVAYVRDPNGNPLSLTDANGNTTTHAYDALDRRVSSTVPSGDTLTITYDALGRIVRQQLGSGRNQNLAYDALGRVVQISDDLGVLKTSTHGASDRVLSETDADGDTTTFAYDGAGRLVTRGYPDGSSESMVYDAAGRLVSVTDRNGNQVAFTRDARGRITQSTTATGETITGAYDGNDNLISLTDANGNTTTYGYDAEDRRTVEGFADSTQRTSTYDAEGRRLSVTQRDGTTIAFTYDERGRLTLRDFPGSNDDIYTYGPAGEMLSASNANATASFTYDADGHLIREDINGRTIAYAYDAANLRRTITYPGGRQVSEVYDGRERLASLLDDVGDPIASWTYDASNRPAQQVNANGTQTDYAYDANGRVSSIAHTAAGLDLVRLTYEYNTAGRALRAIDGVDSQGSRRYVYDADDRLVEFRRGLLQGGEIPSPDRQISYALDAVGNWTSVVRDGTAEARTVGTENRYTAVGGTAFAYDARGNLTDDGENLYDYDAAGRLISVTRQSDGAVLAQYEYGPLGRRIAATDATGLRTEYFYDQRLNVIEEQVGGATTATYVHGLGIDDLVTMDRGGSTYFYHHDQSRHVVALSDAGGGVVESYRYDPYGAATVFDAAGTQISASAVGNPYLFTGRRYDADAGIYYFRARYYDPELGRFLSEDSAGFVDGMNLYEYATGDPVNFFDPLGLGSKSCKISGSIEFDASSKIQKITGEFLKAFGLKFTVGGGVKVEIKACEQKCCEGDTTRTVTFEEFSVEANLKMEYGGPIPGLSVSAPLIGSVGVHGTLSFSVTGSGSREGSVSASCQLTFSGKACAKFGGSVTLLLGGKLAEAPGIDPFSGKVGIEGKGSLTGEVCYGTGGWSANACLSGSISLVAEIKVFWVTVGGSYEIIGGQFCAN